MGPRALEESGPPLTDADPPPPVRAFFALALPEAHRQRLSPHLAECAALAPGFRWVAAANLHFTLRFIGSVARAAALRIAERIATHVLPAPRLELGELGTFKRGRLVRVVWVGLRSGSDAARAVAAAVEAECAGAGLESESRPFTPHLTLARARDRDGAQLPELPPLPTLEVWTADELILYQSHLGRQGSVYEPLARIPLGRSD